MPRPQLRRAQEEVPGGQKWPPGHCWQDVEPAAAANVPGRHGAHVEGAVAPTRGLNEPAGQDVHVDKLVAPAAALKVPAAQNVQVALDAAPVAAEKVPAVQLVKLTLPQPLQKAPAGQTMGAAAGQKKPGLHGHRLATCAAFRVTPHSFNSSRVAVMDMKVGDAVEPT